MHLTVSLLKSSFWKRIVLTRAGFYPSTFLQPENGRKNSISSSLFKYFFVLWSRKNRQIFVFFYTTVFTFVSLKYVQNKQAQLFDSQFHEKVSGAAFKKSKTNMMVQMLLFLFLRVLLIA